MAQYVWICNGEACLVNANSRDEALRKVLADRMQAIWSNSDQEFSEEELASEAMRQFRKNDELYAVVSELKISSAFQGKLDPELEEEY